MVNHTDATTMTSSLPQMLSPSGSSAVVSDTIVQDFAVVMIRIAKKSFYFSLFSYPKNK
jgi:hypothetical protein